MKLLMMFWDAISDCGMLMLLSALSLGIEIAKIFMCNIFWNHYVTNGNSYLILHIFLIQKIKENFYSNQLSEIYVYAVLSTWGSW